MNTYYQELVLLPHEDVDLYFIWHKLFQQIHIALAANKTIDDKSQIGVGFFEYHAQNFCLGKRLHLFAENEKLLEQMNCEKWLNRLRDYVHIQSIKPVPDKLDGYACFRHIKLKGNKGKLARRRAKRKRETLEQAMAYYEGFEEQSSNLPYINMISQTNGQRFKLLIEKQEKNEPHMGLYSCYGLSNSATVPIF